MIQSFHVGETVIFSIEITDLKGNPVDPVTSVKVTIKGPNGDDVDNDGMIKDGVGKYHYDFNPTQRGTYNVIYTDIDGGRTTIATTKILL